MAIFFKKKPALPVNVFDPGCTNRQMHPRFMIPIVPYLLTTVFGIITVVATAQSCDGTLLSNLITNGDFGSGPNTIVTDDPLLAPGYQYQNTPPPDDGFYTITSVQYRVLVANGPVNYLNPHCRATSTATTIELQTPQTIFLTPVICAGDTLTIGGQQLTTAGNYLISLPGNSGCDTLLCQGNTTTWSGPNGFNDYQWSTGATTSNIDVSLPGTYQLTITNSQGCAYVLEQQLIVSDPFFDTLASPISCPDREDGSIEVLFADGGLPPYTFQLGNGSPQADFLFSGLATGSYELALRDEAGCTFQETLTIGAAPELNAQLNGIPSAPIEVGDTLQLSITSAADSLRYQWSRNGRASCDTCATTNWLIFPNGALQVTMTTPEGCRLVIDTLLNVLDATRIYQPNAFSPNNDGNNDIFTLGLGSNAEAITRLEIFDRWGGAVYQYTNRTTNLPHWDGTRNGTDMPTGVYVYQAEIQFQNGRRKLL